MASHIACMFVCEFMCWFLASADCLFCSALHVLREVELVGLVKYLSYLVYLKECGASLLAEATAEVGYLVVEADVVFLTEHAESSSEHVFR